MFLLQVVMNHFFYAAADKGFTLVLLIQSHMYMDLL